MNVPIGRRAKLLPKRERDARWERGKCKNETHQQPNSPTVDNLKDGERPRARERESERAIKKEPSVWWLFTSALELHVNNFPIQTDQLFY